MKRLILLIFMAMASSGFAQLVSTSHSIQNDIPAVGAKPVLKGRSAAKPTKCDGDTSMFPSYGSTAYNSITIKKGSSLGIGLTKVEQGFIISFLKTLTDHEFIQDKRFAEL